MPFDLPGVLRDMNRLKTEAGDIFPCQKQNYESQFFNFNRKSWAWEIYREVDRGYDPIGSIGS